MKNLKTKFIHDTAITAGYAVEDQCWYIEDGLSGDSQTYSTYDEVMVDFDKIVDEHTLFEVFGWER